MNYEFAIKVRKKLYANKNLFKTNFNYIFDYYKNIIYVFNKNKVIFASVFILRPTRQINR